MLLVPWLAAVTLSLSDNSGAELRSIPERHSVSLDLSTSPAVDLTVTSKRSVVDLAYRPRFGWVDVTHERDFVLLHTANMGYAWGTRRMRLSLTLGGSYGKVSYLNAVVAAAPVAGMENPGGAAPGAAPGATPGTSMQTQTVQVLPQISLLQVGSASASLNMTDVLSRRWLLSLGIGFGAGGGLAESETFLPFRYGPFASAGLGYQWTKLDLLGSDLSGTIDILPKRHSRFQTITLLESWTHNFNPLARSTLSAGATFVQSSTRTQTTQVDPEDATAMVTVTSRDHNRTLNAAGGALFWKGFRLSGGAMLGVTTSAMLTTNYNPVLGTVAQNLGGSLLFAWSRKRLAFTAGAQGTHSVPFDDPNGFSSYGATGGMTYVLTEAVSLRAGGYWTHQILPPTAAPTTIDPNRWGVTLGVLVAAPPIRL